MSRQISVAAYIAAAAANLGNFLPDPIQTSLQKFFVEEICTASCAGGGRVRAVAKLRNHSSRLGENSKANIGTSLPKMIQTCVGFVRTMRAADGAGAIARHCVVVVAVSIQIKISWFVSHCFSN